MTIPQFQRHILAWYKDNRRDLPWRPNVRWRKGLPISPRAKRLAGNRSPARPLAESWLPISSKRLPQDLTPYHILVSEIMLQQTQVPRVLQKYPEFLHAFPTCTALARAPRQQLFSVWQGMGYWRRALYIQETARRIQKEYSGHVPSDLQNLRQLPGIGPYTAGAIACFAYQNTDAFIDINIRRVYIKFFFIRKQNVEDGKILRVAQKALWRPNPREWHYALMDYGSLMLGKERTLNTQSAHYYKQTRFEGSPRFWRAHIIRFLLAKGSLSRAALSRLMQKKAHEKGYPPPLLAPLLSSLQKDGIVRVEKNGNFGIK